MTRPADPGAAVPEFVLASRLVAAAKEPFRPGPDTPGVYLFRNAHGEVVYVGKSRRLRHRVLSHLNARVEKSGEIVSRSSSVEFVPTENEREALLLEASLVKQYQPPFNTLLKDDRSYPYLVVTLGEPWPRVLFVRRPRRDPQNVVFGPYTSAREARGVATLLAETFQIRRCVRLPKRACLYYHLRTCSGPCIGAVDADAYDLRVRQALQVLRGHGSAVRPSVEAEMRAASQRQDYERAALLRDALQGLAALEERQHVVTPTAARADVIALALPRDAATLRVAVGLLRIEEGEVRQTEPHLLAFPPDDLPDQGELLRQFLVQYYGHQTDLPPKIYIAGPRPAALDEVLPWLEGEKGVKVRFRPTGRPASWARLAERLARSHLDQRTPRRPPREVLLALMSLLELPAIPNRIEGVDISIFQGSEAVGSLVVFDGGAPNKDEYRRFRIRTVPGMNDFAMVAEVVRRRFTRLLAEEEKLPDLLLIDGGLGQLASALAVLSELGIADRVPAIGLAKQREEIYLPERAEPLDPNPNSPPVLLLRAVRDEAHRFAITYHRTRRRMGLRQEMEAASPRRPRPTVAAASAAPASR
jgi:excinuclease ABC subunit C